MTCGFSEEELRILHKICYKGRNCPHKHISKEDLLSGFPVQKCKQHKDALHNLVKNGYLMLYKSQNRNDVCFVRDRFIEVLNAFKEHQDQYPFIRNIEQLEKLLAKK